MIRWLGERARQKFVQAGGQLTDGFVGILTPEMLAQENPWGEYLKRLPASGSYEMMTHPGYADASLEGRDTYLRERTVELEALLRLGGRIHGGE